MADGGDGTVIPFPQTVAIADPIEEAVFGTDSLLNEREKTHGPYDVKAGIIQDLKRVMQSAPGWYRLSPSQRESLDMIQHKIGRILSGNPNHPDHWEDIQGYARLISKALSNV
jgi:hypothetical protein